MEFLKPIAGYALKDNAYSDANREQLGVADTAGDTVLENTGGNKMKRRRIKYCSILQTPGKKHWEI
jgi:hypothetical protein